MFGTASANALVAADTRPTLAFFDFDPKGLSMAASLPRRERLCLPDWPRLEAQTRRMKRAHLDGQTDPDIAEAWRRMRALFLWLNQEGFPR